MARSNRPTTCSSAVARRLGDYSVNRGLSHGALARIASSDGENGRSPEARISVAVACELLEALVDGLEHELAHVEALREITAHECDAVGLAVRYAPGPQEALDAMLRYSAFFCEAGHFVRGPTGSTVTLDWVDLGAHEGRGARLLAECVLAGLVLALRAAYGSALRLDAVWLAHASPSSSHASALSAWLGCPVMFSARRSGLAFHESAFEGFEAIRDDVVLRVATRRADELTRGLGATLSIQKKVHELVAMAVRDGRVADLAEPVVAKQLGMSERTLRRALDAHGVTYREVRDMVLRSTADDLLGSQPSLKGVAEVLGFSCSSAFVRAYRRWTGESPIVGRRTSLESLAGACVGT